MHYKINRRTEYPIITAQKRAVYPRSPIAVAAASAVSLAGDVAKVFVFSKAGLFEHNSALIIGTSGC